MPDFLAHVMPGNGNGKRHWFDKFWAEGLRLLVVGVIALAGAYFTLNRAQIHIEDKATSSCIALNAIVTTQRTQLLAELAMIDSINQLVGPNLDARVSPTVRIDLLNALSRLPEARIC